MSTLRVPGHFSRHGSQVLGSRTLRVAPHPVWGQVRHRHLGFDARPRSQWPLPTPRHGPRPIQAGLQNLAGLPASHLARGRSWTPSTSYTSPGMLSMSAADAPGKSSTIDAGVPSSLTEIITLGRTLKRRSRDILAYFDHPHTSNDPTEATNGRLEHLGGCALGFAKPHQLHHPSTPRNRRLQTPTTPSIMKSH